MSVYSAPAHGMQPGAEYIPTSFASGPVRTEDDKKANRNRAKSPYRDAYFREWFQQLDLIEGMQHEGGTSVSESVGSGSTGDTPVGDTSTPSQPTHPQPAHPQPTPSPSPSTRQRITYSPEKLTPKRQAGNDRFWRAFEVPTPGLPQYRSPAHWRDLSDVARFEWLHHAMRLSGPLRAFTLNFSPEVEAQLRQKPNAAKWMADRMSRRLKQMLGYCPAFWFAFDVTDNRTRVHSHGEIAITLEERSATTKALRLAGGEWECVRQHQAHIRKKEIPDVGWANYGSKNRFHLRPHTPSFQSLTRPISGDWYFATNEVRSLANEIYTIRREQAISFHLSATK